MTIPAAVRRRLWIETPGFIVFEVDESGVRLVRQEYTLESVYQSVPRLDTTLTIEEMVDFANEEWALEAALKDLRMMPARSWIDDDVGPNLVTQHMAEAEQCGA